MDLITNNYYNRSAKIIANHYRDCSPDYINLFQRYFRQKGRILDIGAGSGRDVNILQKLGFDAFGLEPSAGLLNEIEKYYPEVKTIEEGSIPDNIPESFKEFDGVLVAATLQHIPNDQLFDSIFKIHKMINESGILILSIPTSYPNIQNNRDNNSRLFHLRPKDEYLLLLERVGFGLIEESKSNDAMGRKGIVWTTLVLKKTLTDHIRPIDKIESIIREDRKVTTYKFALLRAFGELASNPRAQISWDENGFVKIPVDAISVKWIEYYWPLIISEKFIYQGQKIKGKSDISFRETLKKLAAHWEAKGDGFLKYDRDKRRNNFNSIERELYCEVIKRVRDAIINGPVKHMGNRNSETEKLLLHKGGEVYIPGDLWREFSLIGRWFEDSIILRWAELTDKYKHNDDGVDKAYILGKLLFNSDLKRNTSFSKSVFDDIENKICVWSGKKIVGNRYDVDHAIPYAVWRNNASWNLFPANSQINNQKRDKLPERKFLLSRKKVIFNYWDSIYEREKSLFEKDLQSIAPNINYSKNNKEIIFSHFTEHMEMLALRNDSERWSL